MATKQHKLPLEESFAYLCAYVGNIGQAVARLAAAMKTGFDDANAILLGKQNINEKVDFSIPATGWKSDTSIPEFPNYMDVSVAGLLATDTVAVDVSPASTAVARAADFTNTASYAGYFRIRCKNIPTAAISAQYSITNHADYEPQTDETEEAGE